MEFYSLVTLVLVCYLAMLGIFSFSFVGKKFTFSYENRDKNQPFKMICVESICDEHAQKYEIIVDSVSVLKQAFYLHMSL